MEKWFAEAGVLFLQGLGIDKGHYVLDFGCGEGYYTIPAAMIVGAQGQVYAIDKDEAVLAALAERAKKWALNNIVLMPTKTDLEIGLYLPGDLKHASGLN
ncbi:MAG: methyltransferase domain-containing protein [Desulfobacteraceae bacterium]